MANSDVTVRWATPSDGAALLKLVEALADYEKLDPPAPAAQDRLLRDTFGEAPRIEILLGELNGTSAGYAIILETYSSFLALPTLLLEDLFVLPEYRKRRVGYELFKRCVQEAQARGCGRMEWMTLDWNHPAHRFWKRLGARQLSKWLPYRLTREQFGSVLNR
jgi:GNAT superfamily N-acetyltransferase